MKRLALASAVCISLLGGCTAQQTQTFNQDLQALVQQVQQDAIAICGFKPIFDDVASLIQGTSIGNISIIIANAICNAVKTPGAMRRSARRGLSYVTVNGKQVHGTFVTQ